MSLLGMPCTMAKWYDEPSGHQQVYSSTCCTDYRWSTMLSSWPCCKACQELASPHSSQTSSNGLQGPSSLLPLNFPSASILPRQSSLQQSMDSVPHQADAGLHPTTAHTLLLTLAGACRVWHPPLMKACAWHRAASGCWQSRPTTQIILAWEECIG